MEEDSYNEEEFENAFKQKFEDFEDMPPPMAWKNISEQIERKPASFWRLFLPFCLFLPLILKPIQFNDLSISPSDNAISQVIVEEMVIKPQLISTDDATANTLSENELNVTESELLKNDKNTIKRGTGTNDMVTSLNGKTKTTKIDSNATPKKTDNSTLLVVPKSEEKLNANPEKADNTNLLAIARLEERENKKNNVHLDNNISKEPKNEREKAVNILLMKKLISITIQDIAYAPLPNLVLSQPIEIKEATKEKPNALFLYISPNYSLSHVKPNANDKWFISEREESKKLNINNIGMSAGLGLEKKVSDRLNIALGLSYTLLRKELKINYHSVNPVSTNTSLDSAGNLYIKSVFDTKPIDATFLSQQIGAQLELSYQIKLHKLQFAQFGFRTDLILNLKTKPSDLINLEKNQKLQNTIFLGYEWQKPISPKWNIGFSPQANYYLSSLLSDASSISNKPYTFGFRLRLLRR